MANVMKQNNNGGLNTSRPLIPFDGFVDGVLKNSLSRFFDDHFWAGGGMARPQVPVNIRETETDFQVEVIAPGLRKEDFNVQINEQMLTVAFEHSSEDRSENRQGGYLRQEYRVQSFSRSFGLDDSVDAEKIEAQYKDGVLQLRLPKKEEARRISRNIQIQ